MYRVIIYLLVFLISLPIFSSSYTVTGKVISVSSCHTNSPDDFVVFLSTKIEEKEQYLYQVELPVKGQFEFVLKKGSYNLTVISKKGCSYSEQIDVDSDLLREITIRDSN